MPGRASHCHRQPCCRHRGAAGPGTPLALVHRLALRNAPVADCALRVTVWGYRLDAADREKEPLVGHSRLWPGALLEECDSRSGD
jgi:hypothetical protein